MSSRISVTPTITAAGAYASLDAVGGKLEFEEARTPYSSHGHIEAAKIIDNDSEDALLRLILFNQDFTATADNAAMSITDADLANCMGVISFTAANYLTFATNSIGTMGLAGIQVLFPFVLVGGGTSLFGQLMVETSTPTYTAVDDLTVVLTIHD
jgi:hypothetical protein